MGNVRDLIKASMRVAGVIEKSEEPTDDEMNDALSTLSTMLRSWSVRHLMVRATVQESLVLTPGKEDYTIGVGGNLNTTKPFKITSAFTRDSNNSDYGVDIVTKEVYDSYRDKAISQARPEALYYDPGTAQQTVQTGTIWLYNIPDSSTVYTLFINSQKPFTDFTSINDTVTFEPPYEEAIKYELAIRLWREYHSAGSDIPQDIWILAKEAMHTVEMMNVVTYIAGMDIPGVKQGQVYNIHTGENNG